MRKKIIFERVYTRDTTYVMQELWAWVCARGVEIEFGWKNPYLPGIIHYMNDGSIEIWENFQATKWLENSILKKNKENSRFINKVLKKYKNKLLLIQKIWKKKILSINDLERLIALSKEVMVDFVFYYYSAIDERTPNSIRKKVLRMRNSDEFFAKNDKVIRDSVLFMAPQIKGYETAILLKELRSIPSLNILKKRRKNFVLVQGKICFAGNLKAFNKKNSNFIFKKDLLEPYTKNEIKGEIAQKGKVIGIVKIIRRRDQLNEVTSNNIIVSPMTTPDFLSAMKKAKAFITDEGGITCHAGIIARELKKPCIIGTKIATRVLHDGDRVEVDANIGIIKIIQRKK